MKLLAGLALTLLLLTGCQASDQTGYGEGLTDSYSGQYERDQQDAYDQARDEQRDYEIRQNEEHE